VDPQNPSNPEPTSASPAPTQTSPVTPEPTPSNQPATTNSPLQPQPSTSPSTNGNKHIKKLTIAIIAAIIVVGGLVFLLLSPWSPFVAAAPSGPKLMVGDNPYVYACPVMDKATIAKQLDVSSDVNKEGGSETNAFDPANSKDKQEDLAKLTDSESISSGCTVKLDRVQEGSGQAQRTSFINVSASIVQFKNTDKAATAFKNAKARAKDTKALPSFTETSFYEKPQALYQGLPISLEPQILYKNMVITLAVPTGANDATGEKNAPKLDAIAKDITARIGRGEGTKPQNFNGINQLHGHKFTDSCASVNYAKVAEALGNNTQLNAQSVSGTQAYAPDNNKGTTPDQIISGCNFSFRTQAEADAANAVKDDSLGKNGLSYGDKYPHYLNLQIAVTGSKEDAQAYLKQAKSQGEANAKKKTSEDDKATIHDVQLGDGALAVGLTRKYPASQSMPTATTSNGQLYYIAKGPNVYIISTTYVQQDQPFKTELRDLNLDQVKKIYKELTLASRRAN